MIRLLQRFDFAHRELWRRDPAYRAAALLGPPPLLGVAAGAALWAALAAVRPGAAPRWGVALHQAETTGALIREAPAAALPAAGADGGLQGYAPGWLAGIHQADVSPTLNVTVHSDTLATYTADASPVITLAQIVRAGPKTGLFVGLQEAWLAVRVAGRVSLALRTDRAGGATADCLVRFSIARHRVVSQYEESVNPFSWRMPDPAELELQPGLYRIGAVFGCWRGQDMIDTAKLTLMMRRPGESAFQPVDAGDIVRPMRAGAPG